jgi:hypothetical protein
MRALLSTCGSRGYAERIWVSPELGVLTNEFDSDATAAAEECDARVATGVIPIGGWR